MKFDFVECTNALEWDQFLDESDQGNIFCQSQTLSALDSKNKKYFVVGNSKTLMGALINLSNLADLSYPSSVFLHNSINRMVSHRKAKISYEIISYLLLELEKLHKKICFSLHYSFKDIRGFQWFNFHETNKPKFSFNIRYTGIIQLQKFDTFSEYLQSCRQSRRQDYKKALKAGYYCEISDNISALDRVHQLTFERQGLKRSQGELYLVRKFASYAIKHNFGTLLLCKNKLGTTVAASFFIFDNNCSYYLIGASDPEYRNAGVGTLIILEQIKLSINSNTSFVDLVGINSPERGDFKTSFNAEVTQYIEAKLNENDSCC